MPLKFNLTMKKENSTIKIEYKDESKKVLVKSLNLSQENYLNCKLAFYYSYFT